MKKIQKRREKCYSVEVFLKTGMHFYDFTLVLLPGNWIVRVSKREISSYSLAIGTKYLGVGCIKIKNNVSLGDF